jgi:hypothetical protein
MFLYIGGLGRPEFLIAMLLGCMPFILIVFALIDIIRSDFRDSNTKLIWVIIVIFVPVLGSILYFLMGRNQKERRTDRF